MPALPYSKHGTAQRKRIYFANIAWRGRPSHPSCGLSYAARLFRQLYVADARYVLYSASYDLDWNCHGRFRMAQTLRGLSIAEVHALH